MAIRTDAEPLPRQGGVPSPRWRPSWPIVAALSRPVRSPDVGFLEVLGSRTTRAGGILEEGDLAALLHHSTFLRHRGDDGRFGTWESRTAPAAGGLHGIHMFCLPIGSQHPAGLYAEDDHALLAPGPLERACDLNARSVAEIAGATAGTSLQFVADFERYDACYQAAESLMWRDAGVLAAFISLVGTALDLVSIPLGRHGVEIVDAIGMDSRFIAVGGVHVGTHR